MTSRATKAKRDAQSPTADPPSSWTDQFFAKVLGDVTARDLEWQTNQAKAFDEERLGKLPIKLDLTARTALMQLSPEGRNAVLAELERTYASQLAVTFVQMLDGSRAEQARIAPKPPPPPERTDRFGVIDMDDPVASPSAPPAAVVSRMATVAEVFAPEGLSFRGVEAPADKINGITADRVEVQLKYQGSTMVFDASESLQKGDAVVMGDDGRVRRAKSKERVDGVAIREIPYRREPSVAIAGPGGRVMLQQGSVAQEMSLETASGANLEFMATAVGIEPSPFGESDEALRDRIRMKLEWKSVGPVEELRQEIAYILRISPTDINLTRSQTEESSAVYGVGGKLRGRTRPRVTDRWRLWINGAALRGINLARTNFYDEIRDAFERRGFSDIEFETNRVGDIEATIKGYGRDVGW